MSIVWQARPKRVAIQRNAFCFSGSALFLFHLHIFLFFFFCLWLFSLFTQPPFLFCFFNNITCKVTTIFSYLPNGETVTSACRKKKSDLENEQFDQKKLMLTNSTVKVNLESSASNSKCGFHAFFLFFFKYLFRNWQKYQEKGNTILKNVWRVFCLQRIKESRCNQSRKLALIKGESLFTCPK